MIVELVCVDADAATALAADASQYGGDHNTVRAHPDDPTRVVIDFFDARYPIDVAEWAYEHDWAHDHDAARCIAAVSDAVDAAKNAEEVRRG